MNENYKELINELEIHTNMRESFDETKKYWLKQFHSGKPKELSGQNYSNMDMPKGSRNEITLDRVVENIRHYETLVEVEDEIIKTLYERLNKINALMKESDNIYNKVAYLKYQKDGYGKRLYPLEKIAEMLNYSVDWIKQISAKV